MNLLETILAAQNGGAARQLGRQFGLGESQTNAALSALVPALAAGFSRNMQQEGGLASLAAALAGGRHTQYLDDAGSLQRPETVADGNGILGHIFGSKDVSRQVAARAAQSSGISPDILTKMLPLVAAMAMGSMAQRTGGTGSAGLGASLGGGLPGGDLLGMLTPMLDADRDGSVMDDVAGLLGKFMGGR
jgi:hypothetical protein